MTLSFPPSARLNKIMLPGVFFCRSGYRQRTEFLKQIKKAYFQTVLDVSLISVKHSPEPRKPV
jgi:hypothetical protein